MASEEALTLTPKEFRRLTCTNPLSTLRREMIYPSHLESHCRLDNDRFERTTFHNNDISFGDLER